MAKCLDIRYTDNLFVAAVADRQVRGGLPESLCDGRQALRDQRYLVYHSTMLPTAFENQGSVS